MKFPKSSTGYNIPFSKKQVSDDVNFMEIKNDIYGVLSMDELCDIGEMFLNFMLDLAIKKDIIFFSRLFKLWLRYKFT